MAFTLAETLIVMGIIGVVAALTLPNLNSSTGEKEKVVKVKKVYSNLNDAYGRAQAVYGPATDWFINDNNATAQQTRFMDRLTEFMKISKKVSNTSYILADGTSINLETGMWNVSTNTIYIDIDIDGPNKGKNSDGYDIFRFCSKAPHKDPTDIDMTTIKPLYDDLSFLGDCGSNGSAFCTGWVINFENMDYLKTDSNRKCKNNSSVTLNALANPPVVSCK
ncbi:type II secretion system protein [bacterium]|nr:type II secretion system protein [bacterium]